MDFNKLWQNFADTVQNHYLDFDGRAGRPQFWYYVLVYVAVGLVVSFVASVTGLGLLRTLYSLGLFLPSLAITARRLHDTGKPTAWVYALAVPFILEILLGVLAIGGMFVFGLAFLLAGFVTLINLLVLAALIAIIYFCAQQGDAGANPYGVPPPVFSPN